MKFTGGNSLLSFSLSSSSFLLSFPSLPFSHSYKLLEQEQKHDAKEEINIQ